MHQHYIVYCPLYIARNLITAARSKMLVVVVIVHFSLYFVLCCYVWCVLLKHLRAHTTLPKFFYLIR
ncbi:Uncharacterised protein [Vibrio cholerae]|nr:Uncharacterised protein [Vibrio cholerae]